MARSDAEHLEVLKSRRDKLEDALATPEVRSGFGGFADSPGNVQRMPGRAQLQAELTAIKQEIQELQVVVDTGTTNPEAEVYLGESRGAY